jgi:hypothetical protein
MKQKIAEITMGDELPNMKELIDYIIMRIYPDASDAKRATAREQAENKTHDELLEIYRQLKSQEEAEKRWMEEDLRISLEENLPFNKTGCEADFARWAVKAHWTPEEAAALLFGRDPKSMNWKTVQSYVSAYPSADMLDDAFDRIKRAVDCAQLVQPISPVSFLGWAKNNGFGAPSELESLVFGAEQKRLDWESRLLDLESKLAVAKSEISKNKKLIDEVLSERDGLLAEVKDLRKREIDVFSNPKERTTVYKIIVGALYCGWKYDPNIRDNKGKLAEFIGDLNSAGIKVGIDTAREKLREAAQHIHFTGPPRNLES